MIKLRSLIQEIVDGKGYFTKEKFGSIVLRELQREFPKFVSIELNNVMDLQQEKHSAFSRSDIHNSSIMAIYIIEYNDNEYEVRIHNIFKKVPDDELTDKFTMADDEFLRKMNYKSLEPKDLNLPSPLLVFECRVKRSDGKVLIPKKQGYSILFDRYRTLKETLSDVRKVIEKDSGFGGDSIVPDSPRLPSMQLREVNEEEIENLQGKDAILQYLQTHNETPEVIELGEDEYIIWNDNILDPEYPVVKKKQKWIYDLEAQRLISRLTDAIEEKFNHRFWENPETLFHATQTENIPAIKREGLKALHKSRGLANRHIRSAVFTSTDPDWITNSYGPSVITIHTGLMKKDGFMPMVTKEPNHTANDVINFIARKIKAWDDDRDFTSSTSEGTTEDTIIVRSPIPSKYLSFEGI